MSTQSTIELESVLGRRVCHGGHVELKCRWKSRFGEFEAWEPMSTFTSPNASEAIGTYFEDDAALPEYEASLSDDSDDDVRTAAKTSGTAGNVTKQIETVIAYQEVKGVPSIFCKWKHESLGCGAWVPLERVVDKLGVFDLVENAKRQWTLRKSSGSRRGVPYSLPFDASPRQASQINSQDAVASRECDEMPSSPGRLQTDSANLTRSNISIQKKIRKLSSAPAPSKPSNVALKPTSVASNVYTNSFREPGAPVGRSSAHSKLGGTTEPPSSFVSSLLTTETATTRTTVDRSVVTANPIASATVGLSRRSSSDVISAETLTGHSSSPTGQAPVPLNAMPPLAASEGLVARDLKMIREKLRVLGNANTFDPMPKRVQVAGPIGLSNAPGIKISKPNLHPPKTCQPSSPPAFPLAENLLLPTAVSDQSAVVANGASTEQSTDQTYRPSESRPVERAKTPPSVAVSTERRNSSSANVNVDGPTAIPLPEISAVSDDSGSEDCRQPVLPEQRSDSALSQSQPQSAPSQCQSQSAPSQSQSNSAVRPSERSAVSCPVEPKASENSSVSVPTSLPPAVLPPMELWLNFLKDSRRIRERLKSVQSGMFDARDRICFCRSAGRLQNELVRILESSAMAGLIPGEIRCSMCGGESHFECFVKALEWEFSTISFKYHYRSLADWVTREFLTNWLEGFICVVCRIAQGDPFFPVEEILQVKWLAPTHTGNFSKLEPLPPKAPGSELLLSVNLTPDMVKQIKDTTRCLQLRSFRVRSDHTSYPKFPNDEVEIWYLQTREKTMEKLKKPPQLRVRQDTFKLLPRTYASDTSCAQAVKLVTEFESAYDGPYIVCLTKTLPAVNPTDLIEQLKQSATLPYKTAHDFIVNLMFPEDNSSNSGSNGLSNIGSNGTSQSGSTLATQMSAEEAMADADELSVVTISHKIRLSCPSTLVRIRTPARGTQCKHAQCFDLEFFVSSSPQVHHFSRWQCPVCRLYCRPHELIIDSWAMSILDWIDEEIREVSLDIKVDEKTGERSLFVLEQENAPPTVLSL